MVNLPSVLWQLGYPDQALARSQETLTFAQHYSHSLILAVTHYWASRLHMFRGAIHAAQQLAEVAISVSTEHAFAQWKALGTIVCGWALTAQGQVQQGLDQMCQNLTALQAAGSEVARAAWLIRLADVYGRVGQTESGLQVVAEALGLMNQTGSRQFEADLYRLKGELLLSQSADNAEEAESCFKQAISIAQNQSAKSWELRAVTSLARLWQRQAKRDEARELLEPVYSWFTEGFDTLDLIEAKALLDELA